MRCDRLRRLAMLLIRGDFRTVCFRARLLPCVMVDDLGWAQNRAQPFDNIAQPPEIPHAGKGP